MIALGNGQVTKAAIYDLHMDLQEALTILSGLQQGEPDLRKAERAKHTYDWLMLKALQGAGVDNWEGYDIAMEAF